MKLFLILILSLLAGGSSYISAQSCKFDRNGRTNSLGGHILVEKLGSKVRFLSGTVTAPNGEVIPLVDVVLKRLNRSKKVYIGTAETNSNGYFCFGALEPGHYILETGAPGFNPLWMHIRVVSSKSRVKRKWVRLTLDLGT
ncbi:MAG TPA: carboxypeptidase-like regulatory domain-containing protein [Pyrinomonadaceae bacterium]|nr:carboxypeptidase-like regulatory domain-containing protein [Pyrinomonadaceae bacterium]